MKKETYSSSGAYCKKCGGEAIHNTGICESCKYDLISEALDKHGKWLEKDKLDRIQKASQKYNNETS